MSTATVTQDATEEITEVEETPTPAPKPASRAKPSTAVNLIGTRYESFVTDGRFRPGYDAKAKSRMIQDAVQTGDPALAAEAVEAIEAMSWQSHLEAKRTLIARTGEARARQEAAAAERRAQADSEKAIRVAQGTKTPKTNEQLNADLTAAQPEQGLYVRKGKSGWFVMEGEKGIKKCNTEAEAQAFIAAQGGTTGEAPAKEAVTEAPAEISTEPSGEAASEEPQA